MRTAAQRKYRRGIWTLMISLGVLLYTLPRIAGLYTGEQAVKAAADWIEIPATIESFEVRQTRGSGVNLRVVYVYRTNGQEFRSDRDNFFTGWKSSLGETFIAENDTVKVYINPRNPAEAVVNREYYSRDQLKYLKHLHSIGTAAAFAGIAFSIIWIIGLRRQPISATSSTP